MKSVLFQIGSISFADGCVQALSSNPNAWFMRQVEGLLKANGYSLDSTYDELPKALQKKVMYGTTDKVAFTYENMRGEVKEFFTELRRYFTDGKTPS